MVYSPNSETTSDASSTADEFSSTEDELPGGNDAAEDGKKPAKGPMCYNCHVRGHFAADCKTKVCKKCGGRGHDESKCPSPAGMETALAVELPGSDEESTTSSVGAAGFMAEKVDAVCEHPQAPVASGKCDGSVPTCGVEGFAMQVGEAMKGWFFDTGASGHMSPSSEGMINFQPCNKSLRVANDVTLPIEGKRQPSCRVSIWPGICTLATT